MASRRRMGRGLRRRRGSKYDAIKGFRSRRRYYKKVLKSRDITIVNNSKPGINLPINPRYLTKFTLSFSGYTTTAGDGSSGYFAIKLNSPFKPLTIGVSPTIAPNFTAVTNGTGLGNGFSTAQALLDLQPRGYSNLASPNMYQKYRVYASKIKVTTVPSVQADTSIVTVIPVTNSNGIAEIAGTAQNIAFSKEVVVTQGSDNKYNTVFNYVDLQSLYGKTKEQVMADDEFDANYNQNPSDGKIALWVVKYNRLNGNSNYTQQLGFNIEVTYYTELFEMNYESMSIV